MGIIRRFATRYSVFQKDPMRINAARSSGVKASDRIPIAAPSRSSTCGVAARSGRSG